MPDKPQKSYEQILNENDVLRRRLEETEEVLRAIQSGEVDALVVSLPDGERIYTLQGAEQPYRVLVETMSEGAVILASDGTIVYCNKRMASLLGVPQERLIGTSLGLYVAPVDQAFFTRRLQSCPQECDREEMSLTTAEGTSVPVLISCNPIDFLGSEGISLVITDLSEQKRHAAELESQNRELVNTYRKLERESAKRVEAMEELRQKEQLMIQQGRLAAMGEMIGNIAHQWRQPLNNLGLLAQQVPLSYELGLVDKEFLAENTKKQMEVIQHMSRTIDDFRDFFKPEKEKVRFSAHDIVTKTLLLMEGTFKAQQIDIRIDAQNDPVIYGCPNEFSQVLINILANAKDAVIERKIAHPRITIGIGSAEHKAVVTVVDNAGGIPEEIIDKVFDPYFTTKGPNAGTGVGLFMSQVIVRENLGGQLSARNVEDGAEFKIEVWDGSERRSKPRSIV